MSALNLHRLESQAPRTSAASGRLQVLDANRRWDCPHCNELLELTQPDARRFDLLLGICPGCASWFISDETNQLLHHLNMEPIVGHVPKN